MNVLDRLGLAIANAGYTWTPEMRQAYEEGIKELEAAVLAEREKFMAVCEAEYKKYDALITEEDTGHEEATAIIHLMRKLEAMK